MLIFSSSNDDFDNIAKWCEDSGKLEEAKKHWQAFKFELMVKYPPPDGQTFEFQCPHFRALDKALE